MRAKILSLLIVFFHTTNVWAIQFTDSLQISLLTVADGTDAYECFGHSGLRVLDLKNGLDVVFHYGVYNYTEPHFIWHFIEGKCNYSMGACECGQFFSMHRQRHLTVKEQVLRLDSVQNANLLHALLENYKPGNRHYRYNFFFDNCATRPFDMINRWAAIQYDTTWVKAKTLRDMIKEKSGQGNWLDFGISLAIAGRADRPTTFREQMFLPSYLSEAVAHASNQGQPLTAKEIVNANHNSNANPHISTSVTPMIAGLILLLLAIGITYDDHRYKDAGNTPKSIVISTNFFDTIWLLASGITGIILWFLNFYSLHPAVDHNFNCLWFLPTNLLFIAFIWIKKAKKVRRIYFFIIFAAEIIYIISICTGVQYIHPAFVPFLLVIAIRCIARLRNNEA